MDPVAGFAMRLDLCTTNYIVLFLVFFDRNRGLVILYAVL